MAITATSKRDYFVDEAGDPVLFSRTGRICVGQEGCSRYFILGMADIAHVETLAQDLGQLRASLLADPYFKDVPSMQPTAGKTAIAFHAKDDLPEVRREVFGLLHRHEIRFFAVVRDKAKVVEYVRQRNEHDEGYRYHPNELYDYMVRRLFKNLLHKDDQYNIYFARRGATDRTEALHQALDTARQRFAAQWQVASKAMIKVMPATPAQQVGLQAADYLLWALQRLYERREDRFVTLMWPAFSLVHDLDDTRLRQYGVFYTQKKPLTRAALEDPPGI